MEKDISYAFKKSLPVMAGYIFLGIAFGIVLEENGFSVVWAFFISLLVYAGSMQFAMIPLLVGSVPLLTMAVTTLFVNFRHLFYGISFVDSFRKIKQRPYMIFSLTDETYSVLCGCKSEDPEEKRIGSWFWISLFDQCYWITGSVLGAILGNVIPIGFDGIEFSMTALFVVILLEQVLKNPRKSGIIALLCMILAVISLLIFGSEAFLLPALIMSVLVVTMFCMGEKKEGGA